jgi:hypothetical protein
VAVVRNDCDELSTAACLLLLKHNCLYWLRETKIGPTKYLVV